MNPTNTHQVTISPRADIFEKEGSYLLLTDLPGVKAEDVDVRYEKEYLELHAHRTVDDVEFARRFHVANIDEENISAQLSEGVLRLELTKTMPPQARQVPVIRA